MIFIIVFITYLHACLKLKFFSTGVVILRADVQVDRFSRTEYNPLNYFHFKK